MRPEHTSALDSVSASMGMPETGCWLSQETNGATWCSEAPGSSRDRPGFERERGALFGASLAAVKRVHDPAWVLNPGVLIHEAWRDRTANSAKL